MRNPPLAARVWARNQLTLFGSLAALFLLHCYAPRAQGFSLLGPYEPWMLPQNGFAQPGDIGGPMNLGQEYRWNVPVLTYAFDASFVDYFGSSGVAAVENAISILNGVPGVAESSPLDFPLQSSLVNYQAQAENLYDLKSQALALVLEQFGLAAPTRFAFCVRNYTWANDQPQVTVVQRNFDPAAWNPSADVNGTTYDYTLVYGPGTPPASVDAVESPVDPTQPATSAVADGALAAGLFYTGLTRDDAAGLRYLLHTNNLNGETLLPDVHGAGTNAGSYVNYAIRGGVDKITLVNPGNYSQLQGRFIVPYTNQYIDTYVINGNFHQQLLERVVTAPDILFSSADLSNGQVTPRFQRTGTGNWITMASAGAAGPGIIASPVQITFHRPQEELLTTDSPTDASVAIVDNQDYHWGSFDHSTNPPTSYPVGAAPSTNLLVQLEMDFANQAQPVFATWTLPVISGNQATIQTSTNLADWSTVAWVVNRGTPLHWRHTVAHAQRYFRVVAN